MPRFDEGESLTKFEFNDLLMAGSPDNFSKILAQDFFAESITYANLTTLVNNSECVQGKWYKITNATSASFNLLVQAITSNKISCEAKDPLYPNDKIMYNFGSNVITWRWDTINDISAGADWRNSNDIQIGTGCSHIEIGSNCVLSIGSDCSNIKVGNDANGSIGNNCTFITIGNTCSNVILPNNSEYLQAGDNCSISIFGTISNIKMGNNCSLGLSANKSLSAIILGDSAGFSATDSVQFLECYCSVDISTSTYIYNISQTKVIQWGSGGISKLTYLDNNSFIIVDAEA